MADGDVFDDAALTTFERDGYAIGRGIVPRAVALAMGRRVLECARDHRDGEGWRDSLALLHDCLGTTDWEQVRSPRLHRALDQLLGARRWALPHLFGSFPVLFPGFSAPPWQPLDMTWHVEGRTFEHWIDSPEIGVTMILMLSDIGPGDGGTAVAVGSHRAVANILRDATDGMSQMQLSGAFLSAHDDLVAIEARGRAGDILFLHPFTVHATSTNVGGRIRVACNCRAAMRDPLRTSGSPETLSPVERVIARSVSARPVASAALRDRAHRVGKVG